MKKGHLVIFACAALLIHCSGNRADRIGIVQGRLLPCPTSPNCVSSQSDDTSRHVDPLAYHNSRSESKKRLRSVILSMKRAKIVEATDAYIHAEFSSAFFHFVDDVEFLFDDEKGVIHIRSASRRGYWDLGVNRRRAEEIRRRYENLTKWE